MCYVMFCTYVFLSYCFCKQHNSITFISCMNCVTCMEVLDHRCEPLQLKKPNKLRGPPCFPKKRESAVFVVSLRFWIKSSHNASQNNFYLRDWVLKTVCGLGILKILVRKSRWALWIIHRGLYYIYCQERTVYCLSGWTLECLHHCPKRGSSFLLTWPCLSWIAEFSILYPQNCLSL